jgi:hypothetical protein
MKLIMKWGATIKRPRWRTQLRLRTWIALCASLLLLAELSAWGTRPAFLGRLSSGHGATINGSAAIPGSSIYSGDRITTGPDAAAFSLAGGGEIILVGSSTLRFLQGGRGQIEAAIGAGSMGVLSPAGYPVEVIARGIQIHSEAGGGVYIVRLAGESLIVSVRKGKAEIEADNRTIEVSEGQQLEASLAPQKAQNPSTPAQQSRIAKFTLIAAGAMSAAALAIAVIDLDNSCKVSPSLVGSCENAR